MGYFRTAMLLAAMTALFMGIGYLVGGQTGMVVAFLVAAAMNLFAYWNSDKMVLSMYGAREVDERAAPELYGLVRQLAANAEIPMPKVFIMDNPQPNAFATGRNPEHGAVAVTTGLLERLNRDELAGVIAHELGHIKHRDTLTMTITATLAGAISMLANFGFYFGGGNRNSDGIGPIGGLMLVILAPIAAALVQFGVSRGREYEADRIGAEISRKPLSLAEIEAEIGGHGDGAGKRRGDGHGQRVAMLDMAELMRDHAGKLVAVQPVEQPAGDRNRGMLGVASGGECVRLRLCMMNTLAVGSSALAASPHKSP